MVIYQMNHMQQFGKNVITKFYSYHLKTGLFKIDNLLSFQCATCTCAYTLNMYMYMYMCILNYLVIPVHANVHVHVYAVIHL